MKKQKRVLLHALVALIFAAGVLTTASQTVRADDPEFEAITRHLKLHYNARRIHIPFLGLANFFVKIIKPAGVKSFKVAVFQGLNFTTESNDTELGQVMRNALSPDWQSVVRVRDRDGEQVYIYAKADGDNIKLMVVTLDHSDAVVARVKVSPQKLSEFMNNPKILGISVR